MSAGGLLRQPGGAVLAVDDQPQNLELLEEILSTHGYDVATAADGASALASVAEHPPDCVVLDVMMPRLDGFEVCARLKADPATRFIPVIMLTALSEVSDKVRGLEVGADDFLNKPVRSEELLARVRSLVRIKRLRDELDSSASVIYTIVGALESGDPRATGHSERVAAAASATARRLGLPAREQDAVAKGGMLHDVGRLGIPEEVLRAGGRLTAEQHSIWRQHPVLGEKILLPLRSLAEARRIVRHHHERRDGSGYPDGLFGDELSPGAEIVGLANHYDDLVHEEDRTPEAAAEQIRADAMAGKFRREVVEAFLESGAAVVGSKGDTRPEAWAELTLSVDLARTGTILVAGAGGAGADRDAILLALVDEGFAVRTAADGPAALEAARDGDADLLLLDVRVSGLDGFEVCRRLKADPETEFLPVVLMTALREPEDRMRGLKAGADDFLPLPANRLELVARVRSLLRLRTYHRDLEDHQSVVLSLGSVLEARNPYTRGHSARVGDLASRLAAEMGLPIDEQERVRVAGLLHDLGQVSIPGGIMTKPGPLDSDEFRSIMAHPAEGEKLCRPLHSVQAVLPLIRHHHERFDGRGYPDGLQGEAIPVGARLLSLCDAYDALISDRAYRKGLPPAEALSVLARETEDGRWDPQVFARLGEMVRPE